MQTGEHNPPPTPAGCRAAAERVLASPSFQASPQLSAFLQFVVDATLSGQADRIKGYTIGVEALGRGPDFDPQSDPIVRVEAGRLRRMLDRYYAGEGADDPLVIALPVGSYVPTFTARDAAPSASQPSKLVAQRPTWERRPAAAAAVAIAMAAIAVFGIVHVGVVHLRGPARVIGSSDRAAIGTSHGSGPAPLRAAGAIPARQSSGVSLQPTIYIAPVVTVGMPVAPAVVATLVRDRLIDAFARFDDVTVITQPAPPQNPGTDVASSKATLAEGAAYQLGTTIQRHGDGGVSVTFRLVDAIDGVVAWSKTYDNLPLADAREAARYPAITDAATTLFHPFGVIQSRERAKLAAGGQVDPRYACVLASNELWSSFDPAQYDAVRGCLERAIADDPAFAGAFALLARLHVRDFQFGYSGGSGDPSALDRALALARRAIELNPNNARSHYILLEVLTARGATAEGLAEGEKALALNPFDLNAVFHFGAALVRAGKIEQGLEHLRRVDSGGVIPQQQLGFLLFIAAYLQGDDATAARHAEMITGNKYTHGFLARALAAHKAGDQEGARQALDRLVALQPAWRDDPRRELRKFFSSSEIVERLAGDLAGVSLGGAGSELTGSIPASGQRD